MRIVVTTPGGHVGSHVTRLLVQAGIRPTLLTRDASRLDAAIRQRADVIELDLGDVDGVVAATRGADALYWVDPPTGDDDPVAGYERMGRSAAHAIVRNSIARVVFQSSGGAEARGGFGEIDGLARTEQLLDETGAAVTHLRCGYFFTNLLMDIDSLRQGALTTTLPLDLAIPWVDPRDIGEIATARLLSTAWSGRVVQAVHGPEDLSFSDVAEIVGEATGRAITALQVTDDDVASALREIGMTEAQIEGIVGMSRGLRDNYVPEQARDVTTTTPTPLGAWAYTNLRPALRSA
ncbi:NmrA family NAD(P)-binding protein [Rhodococcus chondri]|uniref:NAD(P)H-binding protein n=1 Tax=Rhodococcus chondri TaxID=3065941 RepID=A0ABU7JVV5_9NOCA|nr:NAD(P)H-binding protein [Rhodococcus sp. CC-R104]MEE2033417.1 NAD(P)H-binding protein [Rhodococcus sp. CC-R104]